MPEKEKTPLQGKLEDTVSSPQQNQGPDTRSYHLKGKTIAGINVLDTIGIGAMAIVYNGIRPKTGEQVVLKVLKSELLPKDPGDDTTIPERFRREAQASIALKHSNIVETEDYGEYEGIPYIIQKKVPNSADLSELLKTGSPIKPTLEQSAHILYQIAVALMFSHSQKPPIIHRDVKPSNIIINKENLDAKLIDFGIAKIETDSRLTLRDDVLGTYIYVSPEQVADATTASSLSDLYSWACTAYEVFSRKAPVEIATNVGQTIAANRMNPDTRFGLWLNEAIEQKRQELTEELNTEQDPARRELIKKELEVVVPVSDELEDLIMMILNSKDPKDRPTFPIIFAKYEKLIEENRLLRHAPTAEEEAERKTLQERLLAQLDAKRPEFEADKENIDRKSELTKILVRLAEATPRTDDARAAYLKEAAVYAKNIYETLRLKGCLGDTTLLGITRKLDNTLTTKDTVSWICGFSINEQIRKERRDAKKLEQETKNSIAAALIAIKQERYEDAARTYATIINPDKLSLVLRSGYDNLTDLIKETIRTLLATGLTEAENNLGYEAKDSLSTAKKCDENAGILSKLFPEDSDERKITAKYHQRYLVKEAEQKLNTCKKLLEAGDFYTAHESIEDIEKNIKQIQPETAEPIAKELEQYRAAIGERDLDIKDLHNILKKTDDLEKLLDEESAKANETGQADDDLHALPEESITKYNATMEFISSKFLNIKPGNIGPNYEKFKKGIEFLQGEIQAAKWTLEAEVLQKRWKMLTAKQDAKDGEKTKQDIEGTYIAYGKVLDSLIEYCHSQPKRMPEEKEVIKSRIKLYADRLKQIELEAIKQT